MSKKDNRDQHQLALGSKLFSYGLNFFVALLLFWLLQTLIQTGVIRSYYRDLLILVCINAILAISLNLSTGLLGELTLGHAGFMAVGAYSAALLVKSVPHSSLAFFPSLLLGGILAGLVAWLVGIPALRLRGDYLAIVTLAFGEMITIIIRTLPFTGGALGLSGIPRNTTFASVYWVLVLTIYCIYALIRSRHGRAVISIREDDIAAEAAGIDTVRYKTLAFIISAFFAGVAGGLFAQFQGLLAPEKFNYNYSIDLMVMVVFGGMGSITGSVLSAGVLTLLPELLRGVGAGFSEYRFLLYAIILIILMIFRPEGLLGQKELSQQFFKNLWHKSRHSLPDSYLTEQKEGDAPVGGSSAVARENIPLAGTPDSVADVQLSERTRIDSNGDEPLASTHKGQR